MQLDMPTVLALVSLVISIAALITAVLLHFLRGEHFRAAVETQLAAFVKNAEQTLDNSRHAVQQMEHLTDAAHQLRPELSTYLAHQWKFIEKTFKNRFEKHDICRRIVANYVKENNSILLDSGSSIDLVTYELLGSDLTNIHVYSNNVFAAIHLVGTKKITFHMFQGVFNDRFAATYSGTVNAEIRELPINVFVLAATAFRFESGVMIDRDDQDNADFKKAAIEAFERNDSTKLIIAVDAAKFVEPIERHEPVVPKDTWLELLGRNSSRISIVTAKMPADLSPRARAQFEQELDKFRQQGVRVDLS